MRVESNSASSPSPTLTRESAGQQLQNVFSEVLLQAGRSGYASADPLETDEPLSDAVQQSWSDWFSVISPTAYSDQANPEQLEQAFGDILVKAMDEGGYQDPQTFIRGLSDDELETLQNVHRLAFPIKPEELSVEASLNLLIPVAAQVDADHNGLTEVGEAQTLRFPDSNTPANVVDAWNESTAGLDPKEKMHRVLQMCLPILWANLKTDSDGKFVRRVEPSDPDWVNPLANPNYSYVEYCEKNLNYLETFKAQIPPDRYAQDQSFWSSFQASLERHGAK